MRGRLLVTYDVPGMPARPTCAAVGSGLITTRRRKIRKVSNAAKRQRPLVVTVPRQPACKSNSTSEPVNSPSTASGRRCSRSC
jgi:hypothetical protein